MELRKADCDDSRIMETEHGIEVDASSENNNSNVLQCAPKTSGRTNMNGNIGGSQTQIPLPDGRSPVQKTFSKVSGAEIIVLGPVCSGTASTDDYNQEAQNSSERVTNGVSVSGALPSSPSNIPANTPTNRLSLATLCAIIIMIMENFFESHGRRVARHPVITVAICVVTVLVSGIGVINFQAELRPFKLWLPQNSAFIKMLDWQNEHFPTHYRRHMLVWEAPNVLSAVAVQEMWRLHQAVSVAVEPKSGKAWSDLCARLPSLNVQEAGEYDDYELGTLEFRRRRRETIEELDDISFALSRENYCKALEDMPSFCYETSLLEIWGLNEDIILGLTDEQVIEDFNTATISNVFGFKTNFTSYIGDVQRDNTGRIISAGAAIHVWISKIDTAAVEQGDYKVDLASGQLVDTAGMDWEQVWLDTVFSLHLKSVKIYANAASSFGEVSDGNIWGDVNFLVIGFILMFAFVNGTLGRRNQVEQRPLLSLFGLVSVSMAILASYGICSALSIRYSPVNSILPLLLIGLGVDDMFIITSVWDNDTHEAAQQSDSKGEKDDDLVAKAGRTMRHAGVAITATSLTDVTAFAIGATTQLPALRSFCAFASVGILIVFLLQSSFFLVFLIYDERRLRQKRNGLFWCISHKNWVPSQCSQVDVLNRSFAWYGRAIMKVRYLVLVFTSILILLSIIGTTQLRQEFNPNWFVPRDSYLSEYFTKFKTYFDKEGAQSFFFFSNQSIATTLPKLIDFNVELENADSVLNVHGWFNLFKTYVQLNGELTNRTWTEEFFSEAVSLFLFTPTGGAYRNDIVFQGSIECNVSAPPMKYFRIPFKHRPADTPDKQHVATREIQNLLARYSLPGYEGAWSEAYGIWETNAVVGEELLRNMILTGIVIMITTIVLLVSIRAACLVLLCVTATVLGVAASMQVTGFTVDTVSCISLVLSIGLSVDYSVHIAHTFLAEKANSDRIERAALSLARVGPAVFQGGVSTLIPFVMLAFSNSHVFVTFFSVFTPTTILGMYYALVLLPVLLSFAGPAPYNLKDELPSANGRVNPSFCHESLET